MASNKYCEYFAVNENYFPCIDDAAINAGAPWETRVPSVTPNGCTQPAPAISQPRCTEDGAPYGRQQNERCGI